MFNHTQSRVLLQTLMQQQNKLKIYAENTPGRELGYDITEAIILDAFDAQGLFHPASMTVAYSDARDLQAWGEADVLIAGRLDTIAISHMPSLKMIQCTSAGIEKYIPLDWIPNNAILCNASGAHSSKIREFGTMAVLMLHERIPAQITAQAQTQWIRNLRPTSQGKRVLFYGAGALASALAEGLGHFNFTRIAIGREKRDNRPCFDESYGPDELETVLTSADILVIAAPATAQTKGRFGAEELALLPRGAGLLNIARADLLDHNALISALTSGHLSGAILDVFAEEPLPSNNVLWKVPNLYISPHVSADDPNNYAKFCVEILARNLASIAKGTPLINQVNHETCY